MRSGLTLVVYMGIGRIDAVVRGLTDGGMPSSTAAAAISAAHTPAQSHVLGTLSTLAERVRSHALRSPAILVFGEVVRLSPLWSDHALDHRQPMGSGAAAPLHQSLSPTRVHRTAAPGLATRLP